MDNLFKENRALHRRVKQHILAKEHEFFAVVQPGFEENSKKELLSMGIKIISVVEGGIEFAGKIEDCCRVNLQSRTINRVIMRVQKLRAEKFDVLRKKAEKIPWELYVNNKLPLSFHISSKKSKLYHTDRIEEEIHSAVISRLSQYHSAIDDSDITDQNKVQRIFVRNENNKFQFSIDSSGELLYKRGIKTSITTASLRETLAAQILLEARVEEYDAIIDPMCGSGTFSIEAAGILCNKLAGANREFAFMLWPCFKEKSFEYLKRTLARPENDGEKKIKIYASDIDSESVRTAKENIHVFNMQNIISVEERDFFQDAVPFSESDRALLVINPPYGNRLTGVNIKDLYRRIGSTIRSNYQGCGYAIISPDVEMEKIMALTYDRKIKFYNGGLKVAVIIKDNF